MDKPTQMAADLARLDDLMNNVLPGTPGILRSLQHLYPLPDSPSVQIRLR